MDFAFFESLTPQDAQAFLDRYLEVEREATRSMIPSAQEEGVVADFSVSSVPAFLKWILRKLQTVSRDPDETLPDWIRESESYKRGLIEFEDTSKPLVMRASYYLGESFVRQYHRLSWGVGQPDSIEYKMPVVAGFRHELELAPILVAENIYLGIFGQGASIESIDEAISGWQELVL
jgi:hypothetical protein